MYQLYTDGSCKGNGKESSIGGYAFVVINENNEVEMKFSIGAIKILQIIEWNYQL